MPSIFTMSYPGFLRSMVKCEALRVGLRVARGDMTRKEAADHMEAYIIRIQKANKGRKENKKR